MRLLLPFTMVLLLLTAVGQAEARAEAEGGKRGAAADTPYYELGRIECGSGGVLRVRPPRVIRPVYSVSFRNAELVKWSPDLQVLTNSGWANYDTRRPFYQAITANAGFYQDPVLGAWQGPLGQLNWIPFSGLPPGTYRVRHWLYWGKLGRTYHAVNDQTCHFY